MALGETTFSNFIRFSSSPSAETTGRASTHTLMCLKEIVSGETCGLAWTPHSDSRKILFYDNLFIDRQLAMRCGTCTDRSTPGAPHAVATSSSKHAEVSPWTRAGETEVDAQTQTLIGVYKGSVILADTGTRRRSSAARSPSLAWIYGRRKGSIEVEEARGFHQQHITTANGSLSQRRPLYPSSKTGVYRRVKAPYT